MKLEHLIKYHLPHSLSPYALSVGTSSDHLSCTDVMAALGMAFKHAPLGYLAFCAKMNLGRYDEQRAVASLTVAGLRESIRYPALRNLDEAERVAVIRVIAGYAFQDYARSPEAQLPCHACESTGLRKGKHCTKCAGKGTNRAACKDCKGRGQSLNRMKTQLQGVPVYQPCKRCAGRGFERIATTVVFRAVCRITNAISLATWNKSVKQILVFLTAELHREEAWAETQLIRLTK